MPYSKTHEHSTATEQLHSVNQRQLNPPRIDGPLNLRQFFGLFPSVVPSGVYHFLIKLNTFQSKMEVACTKLYTPL